MEFFRLAKVESGGVWWRWWSSGRILACHAGDRGSIPRQRRTSLQFRLLLSQTFQSWLCIFCKKLWITKGLLPCRRVVRIYRLHRHGWGAIIGMGNFLENLEFLEVIDAVRMIFLPLDEPISRFCCANDSATYSTRDQKVECSIQLKFFTIYRR